MTRFSKLRKLIRITAYVLRFIRNCRLEKSTRRLEPLTVAELNEADHLWIRSSQRTTYSDEIDNLKSKHSRLTLVKQLKLFLDDEGDIRCDERIHNAPVSEDAKFPYLLPPKIPYTGLLVEDAHKRLLHFGVYATTTYLRQKYWITTVRRFVQTIPRKCVVCRKVNGKPYSAPDPPPLPKARVKNSPPFTITGVDFSGALYVRKKNGKESKAYICLFTCAATRTVHLELVPDLSTKTFLQAFRRFCSRKSLPRLMISDNATTYMSAANQLHKLFQSNTVQEELTDKGTEWRFIVKRAPWYGGWWERLVGLTKTAVKKVLGRSYVDSQTLATVVTEIEAILNDRLLTYLNSGEIEFEPLTPSHLLCGSRVTKLPYSEDLELLEKDEYTKEKISRRARHIRSLISNFRERWRLDYLTALREHHRSSGNNQQTIRVGDVVQVHDETNRARWNWLSSKS